MRSLLNAIDLHIPWMLVFVLPYVWIDLRIALVFGILVPQGRILTRAFVDYQAFERSPWPYLVANEGFLLAVGGGMVVLRLAFLWVAASFG